MKNEDEIWQNQMKIEMENSELTDFQKLEVAEKVKNAKNTIEQNPKIENYKKEMKVSKIETETGIESLSFDESALHNPNSQNIKEKLESQIETILPQNYSKNSRDNIKINFQVSHIYIFIFIGIATIILNIAAWNLFYEILSLTVNFYYFPRFGFGIYQILESSFLRSVLLITFVYFNYKIHTKFLTEIFGELEIK